MSTDLGEVVVSTPRRTAIGTFGGMLKDVPASDLGATVIKDILARTGLEGEQVDQVIVGNVLQAGQGMNPGRQVALKAGLPVSVPGMTIIASAAPGCRQSARRPRRWPSDSRT